LLKIVKQYFLSYKRITLPFEIRMSRILLILLFFCACCLVACEKSSTYGIVQYDAQAKIDDSIISNYIRAHGLTGVAKHCDNNDTIGVYYIIINPGQGTTLYSNSTMVTIGDTGRILTTGQLFFETNQFHPSYALGQILPCFQLGIPEINPGGEVRLLVPSRYAYGHFAHPELGPQFGLTNGLPANAVLDFYISLYDVTN
jgi:FKBP-type peptidyl-prolyl cis-trans isomerase FkpA